VERRFCCQSTVHGKFENWAVYIRALQRWQAAGLVWTVMRWARAGSDVTSRQAGTSRAGRDVESRQGRREHAQEGSERAGRQAATSQAGRQTAKSQAGNQ
jgi:hypothetical protein